MKKSLLALAAVAAVAAVTGASAQSTVSLYGRIDNSIGSEKTTVGGQSTSKMFSGNLSTSRWGMRGSEDLGGGLKASFQLESGINTDVGTLGSSTTIFNRQSWLGLSGGLGTVKLGLTDTAFDDIRDLAVSSSLWDSEFTPTKEVYGAGIGDYSSRLSNHVRYETPAINGFSAGLSYGLDEDATKSQDAYAMNVRYKTKELDVGVGYQRQYSSNKERKFTAVSGAYNFGVARVSGGLQRTTEEAKRDQEYSLGVNIPVDKFEFSLGYAHSQSKNAGTKTDKSTGYGAGVVYNMSKRTRVYAALRDMNTKNAAGVKTADKQLYSVGVVHSF